MKIQPEKLEENGYVLLDSMDHQELVPFIKKYLKERTFFSNIYQFSVLISGVVTGSYMAYNVKSNHFTFSEGMLHLAIAVGLSSALIPLHEYIHALAYRSQGAKNTSYDANLRKFYFMALADHFVTGKKEFRVVALAPFLFISTALIVTSFFLNPPWTLTLIGMLMIHTSFCSGDFGLLSYFSFHKDKEVVTYDDKEKKISYFYGKIK